MLNDEQLNNNWDKALEKSQRNAHCKPCDPIEDPIESLGPESITPGQLIVSLLFPFIGFIYGFVWVGQGKYKGGEMLLWSSLFAACWAICIGMVSRGI